MIEYAKQINANQEVLNWCETILAAAAKKKQLDQTEVEHIIDFLASDAAPNRLRKMSYAQAKAGAEKWTKAQQKKGRNLIDGSDDLEVIHDFEDGTKIVKLLTKKAYQREGFFMAHCVGSYDPSSMTVYSYRNAKNEPHATFEVATSDGEIRQIKGKGNGPIHPRYINPILAFLEAIGMDIRPHDMKNLGYIHVDDGAKQILSMFVDRDGKPAPLVDIRGESYLVAS